MARSLRIEFWQLKKEARESENKPEIDSYWRPRFRRDCEIVPRPCLFVACRYNLYLDVGKRGSLIINFPDKKPCQMNESCALDIAEKGGLDFVQDLEGVLNITQRYSTEIVKRALKSIKKASNIKELKGLLEEVLHG